MLENSREYERRITENAHLIPWSIYSHIFPLMTPLFLPMRRQAFRTVFSA